MSDRRSKSPSLELLEVRRLLAGVSLKFNFQPDSNNVPDGYIVDVGHKYGKQSNGLTYGWKSSNESNMRRRDAANSLDVRYDTLGKMSSTQNWSAAVPNGSYDVHLVAGDAGYLDSLFRFTVEGKTAMDARPAANNNWVERHVKVTVIDGKLTIAPGIGAGNDKLCFVEIRSILSSGTTGKISWSKQTNGKAPISRVESGVVQVGNKLYVMGGFKDTYDVVTREADVLDLEARQWSRIADLPGSQTHAGVVSDGTYIYWVAGQYGPKFSTDGTAEAWRYDIATDTWAPFKSLPAARFGGGLAIVNNVMHYFGGDNLTRSDSQSDHWTLDLSDENADWQSAAPMPFPADHISHATVDGIIYVMGGEHDHGKTYVQHDYTFAYDASTETWTRKADMPTPASHFEGATVVLNGKIFCIAGQVDHELLSSEVRAYDIATDSWSLYTSFPEKRKGSAAAVYNGQIYFSGGDAYKNGQPRDLWVATMQTDGSPMITASKVNASGPSNPIAKPILFATDELISDLI